MAVLRRAGYLRPLQANAPKQDGDYPQFVSATAFNFGIDLDALAGEADGRRLKNGYIIETPGVVWLKALALVAGPSAQVNKQRKRRNPYSKFAFPTKVGTACPLPIPKKIECWLRVLCADVAY